MGKKKNKVTYIDDGRTLADMSNVSGRRLSSSRPGRTRPDPKEVWKTYWAAVRMMFIPMLVVITVLGIVYMITYFVLSVM